MEAGADESPEAAEARVREKLKTYQLQIRQAERRQWDDECKRFASFGVQVASARGSAPSYGFGYCPTGRLEPRLVLDKEARKIEAAALALEDPKPSFEAGSRNGVLKGFGGGKRMLTDPPTYEWRKVYEAAPISGSADSQNPEVTALGSMGSGGGAAGGGSQHHRDSAATTGSNASKTLDTKPQIKTQSPRITTQAGAFSFGRAGMDASRSPCKRGLGRYAPNITNSRIRTFRDRLEAEIPPGMPKKPPAEPAVSGDT